MHLHFGTIRFVDTALIVNKLGTSNDLMKRFVRIKHCSFAVTGVQLLRQNYSVHAFSRVLSLNHNSSSTTGDYLPILPLFQLALYQREYPMESLKFHRQAT